MVNWIELTDEQARIRYAVQGDNENKAMVIEMTEDEDPEIAVLSVVYGDDYYAYVNRNAKKKGYEVLFVNRGTPVRDVDGYNFPLEIEEEIVIPIDSKRKMVARKIRNGETKGIGLFEVEDYIFYDIGFLSVVDGNLNLRLTGEDTKYDRMTGQKREFKNEK